MTEQLMINAVFGPSGDRAFLLAEVSLPGQDSSGVTAVLQLSGRSARFKERVPWELRNAWQSSNGTAYFTAANGHAIVHSDGKWRAEPVAEGEPLGFISGINGPTSNDDIVIAGCENGARAFLRRSGKWSELALPEEAEMLVSAAGRSPSEIYIVGDNGIMMWNGSEVVDVDCPNDDFRGILVRPDGDLFITGHTRLHHWSERAQKWSSHKAPTRLTVGIAELQGTVFLATKEGVLRWTGKDFQVASNGFRTNYLARAGETLFALGSSEGVLMLEGDSWVPIDVPVSLVPEHTDV